MLDAARTLIAEQGPGVGLRDIAEHAGVNFGLIYQYVGTKDDLPLIESFSLGTATDDTEIKQQVVVTAKAIEARAKN